MQENGLNIPDWDYINNYISKISNEIDTKIFFIVSEEAKTESITIQQNKFKP